MIALLVELFLDGRLSTRPERARFLVETLCRLRGADSPRELWSPWKLPEDTAGLRVRHLPPGQLRGSLVPGAEGICLLGDALWNRMALESGKIGEIRVRWVPAYGEGDAESFVCGYEPPKGAARLPLRLIQWRKAKDGSVLGRYAIPTNEKGEPSAT